MNNLNSILIEGNLACDPVLHTTPKGTSFCTFSLVSNRFHKLESGIEKEESVIEVVIWARLGETCSSIGKKGRGVRVVGRLKQENRTDKNGKTQSKIFIVAEHVEFRPDFQPDNNKDKENTK